MNKTALSVAAALAMTAGSVQAATVYDENGTTFDIGGSVVLGLQNVDGETELKDIGSGVAFEGTSVVNSSVSVFAAAELEFEADAGEGNVTFDEGFLGADFAGIGTVTAGKFDSVFFQQIGDVIDLAEEVGARDLSSSGDGDQIAFDSADFGGMRFGAQVEIQPEEVDEFDTVTQEGAMSFQAYAGYTMGDLNLAVAFDQADEDITGQEDSTVGFRADYNVLSNLNVGGMVEVQGDIRHLGLAAVYGYGNGDVFATVSHMDNDGDSDMIYAVGANYLLSENAYLFGEFATGSDPDSGIDGLAEDEKPVVTVGMNYDF